MAPVRRQLVQKAIKSEPYEAVFYVWGDPRNRHDLTVNGDILSVTANLHGALTAFQHHPISGSRDGSVRPSWVPGWHSINWTTLIGWLEDKPNTEESEIKVGKGTEGIKGTPLPYLLVRGKVVDEVSAVSVCMETTDFPVTNLTRETVKANLFWLDRI